MIELFFFIIYPAFNIFFRNHYGMSKLKQKVLF